MSSRDNYSLYHISSLAATKTDVIEAEIGATRVIRRATFTNTTSATITIDIYLDPQGTDELHIRVAKPIAPYQTWHCPELEGEVIEAAGTLALTASAVGVACSIPGVKII
jgi:hypothetical protein